MIFYGTTETLMSEFGYRNLRDNDRQDFGILTNGRLYGVQAVVPFYVNDKVTPKITTVVVVTREVIGYDRLEIRSDEPLKFGLSAVFQNDSRTRVSWMENLDFRNLGLLFTESSKPAGKFPCTNPLCGKKRHKTLKKAAMCGGVYKFADKVREGVTNREDWTLAHAGLAAHDRIWQENWITTDGKDSENDFRCNACNKLFTGLNAYADAVLCYEDHFKKKG